MFDGFYPSRHGLLLLSISIGRQVWRKWRVSIFRVHTSLSVVICNVEWVWKFLISFFNQNSIVSMLVPIELGKQELREKFWKKVQWQQGHAFNRIVKIWENVCAHMRPTFSWNRIGKSSRFYKVCIKFKWKCDSDWMFWNANANKNCELLWLFWQLNSIRCSKTTWNLQQMINFQFSARKRLVFCQLFKLELSRQSSLFFN